MARKHRRNRRRGRFAQVAPADTGSTKTSASQESVSESQSVSQSASNG